MKIWRAAAALALVGGAALAAAVPAHAASSALVGTFRLTAGACSGGASGSYFRMINPTGTVDGPFVSNSDSKCGDHTYTLLTPGSDGGLVTGGGYQPAPLPGFDSKGNSLAVRFVKPVAFFGVNFSLSTEATDLQSKGANTAPTVLADSAGNLSGDLRAVDATYNGDAYNQGSPKSDGSSPGLTTPVKGTYDAATGKYVLTWTSQIVGGAFNNFTGLWHLEGTFAAASTSAPSGGGGTKTTATTVKGATGSVTTTTVVAGTTDDTTLTAGGETVRRVAGKTIVHKGWKAPTGIVIVVAIAGVLAVLSLLVLDRRSATEDAS